MKHLASATSVLLLAACTAVPPAAPKLPPEQPQPPSATENVPYPVPDLQSQIDNMGMEIAKLQNQIDTLQTRIRQLERNRPARTAVTVRDNTRHSSEKPSAAPADSPLESARKQYRSGNFAAAAKLLQASESGGGGSEHDRQSMYLLMQSHQRLGNCESVINIGNRYISRFRNSSEAADAMFSIGQCQWNMQQRDVARDTWRKLMLIYPDSAAAKKAAKHEDKY